MWTIFKGAYRLFAFFSVLFVIFLASGGLKGDKVDEPSTIAQPALTADEVKKLWGDMQMYAEFYCGEEEILRSRKPDQVLVDNLSDQASMLYREAAVLYNQARPAVAISLPAKAPSLGQMAEQRC